MAQQSRRPERKAQGKTPPRREAKGSERKSLGGTRGINRATVLGHLGSDPEVRFTQSGQAVANFSVATSARWTDKDGQAQERTEWHRIVAWGATAEACGKYLAKGRQVYVEGSLQTRQWEKDGVERYTTEIVAQSVLFLGKPPEVERGGGRAGRGV